MNRKSLGLLQLSMTHALYYKPGIGEHTYVSGALIIIITNVTEFTDVSNPTDSIVTDQFALIAVKKLSNIK